MDRIAATIGLTASIGPVLIAQIVPQAADLKLLGICILGALISMSACVHRERPFEFDAPSARQRPKARPSIEATDGLDDEVERRPLVEKPTPVMVPVGEHMLDPRPLLRSTFRECGAPDGLYSRFVCPLVGLVWIVVVTKVLLSRARPSNASW